METRNETKRGRGRPRSAQRKESASFYLPAELVAWLRDRPDRNEFVAKAIEAAKRRVR